MCLWWLLLVLLLQCIPGAPENAPESPPRWRCSAASFAASKPRSSPCTPPSCTTPCYPCTCPQACSPCATPTPSSRPTIRCSLPPGNAASSVRSGRLVMPLVALHKLARVRSTFFGACLYTLMFVFCLVHGNASVPRVLQTVEEH